MRAIRPQATFPYVASRYPPILYKNQQYQVISNSLMVGKDTLLPCTMHGNKCELLHILTAQDPSSGNGFTPSGAIIKLPPCNQPAPLNLSIM